MTYPGSLHNHTEYSNARLRDSINRHKELIDYAIELGHEVIAITEHECVCNAIKVEEYYNKIKKEHPNFKVILGNEIYLCRNGLSAETFQSGEDKYYHFILLAKDARGHEQIRELSTRAWLRAYYARNMWRVPTYYSDLEDIIKSDPGHVVASTACLGGYVGTQLLNFQKTQDPNLLIKVKDWCLYMQDIFGKDNFYLELQPSPYEEQKFVNQKLISLAQKFDLPYIITTDSHYKSKEDAPIHKAFLNAQDGEREVDSFYATTYLMGTEEIESFLNNYLTKEQLEYAYSNIVKIKNSCEDFTLMKPLKIPSLVWKQAKQIGNIGYYCEKIPYLNRFLHSDFDGDKRLAELIIEKLESDSRLRNKETYNELNSNLETTWISSEVNNTHWSSYYLNLQNILDCCWDAGTLVGPGRGSGVGFLLLYILGITQINPMWETTKTFAWRFLNPDRVSVLDIDTDIEGARRGAVLDKLREVYGQDRVANVITFGTETSKSAIQTAARGLGIDVDTAAYISSLVPADRGQIRSLHQCYYGDKENDFAPVPLFVQAMNSNPELWNVAQRIENLVCRIGEHAGGIIFVDEPFTKSTALMRAPSGDIITQFDLHDAEKASLIKYDLLSVEALDKIHTAIDLIIENGYETPEASLKETYEKMIGIYNLERIDPKMWEMVWEHKIQSLFQMEQQSGVQGIALTKPENVDDLAILNSVIRLMAQEKGEETPLEKYARYKENIDLWYQEMDKYGLTKDEQALLEPIVKISYGICESQEKFMQLVQMPECGGFPLNWADSLRKAIAKKNPEAYLKLEEEYFAQVKEKQLSKRLCNYVWNVLIATSRGYGFNASHTLAYSLVALQEMNLCHKYPIIFWNTACLITDSGGSEETDEDGKSNNYDKLAAAIGKMRADGVNIVPPDINKSQYTFQADVENNSITFGLRGLLKVGDDTINTIIENRPYSSVKDFYFKVKPPKAAMISLIKSGAFDEFEDRKFIMAWFIYQTCDKKNRITLQNMAGLVKHGLIPTSLNHQRAVFEFNRYLKSVCKKGNMYRLDERALTFVESNYPKMDLYYNQDEVYLQPTVWDKVYQTEMDAVREWMQKFQEDILFSLNLLIFKEDWEKYASGTISRWEMEAMCYYYHEHELANINFRRYGIVDFNSLSEEPEVDKVFYKGDKPITLFKLNYICGTCIAKNKNKETISLLTPSGVVTVKFRKEHFAMFNKQISQRNPDGSKSVVEKSWFTRGNKLMLYGMRRGENFYVKRYTNSPGEHQLYIIDEVRGDKVVLRHERKQGIEEDSND